MFRLGIGVTNLVKERRRFIIIKGFLILTEVQGGSSCGGKQYNYI